VWVVGDVGSEIQAVDFTIGDFEFVARRFGLPWSRTAPMFVWGNANAIGRAGVYYRSLSGATDEAHAVWLSQADWFQQMTVQVISACAAQGITHLYY
jgi:hypothetical protein